MSGVPQGTVLALLLFICYVNDITTSVKSKIRLLADDILLYRPIFTQEDAEILQEDAEILQEDINMLLNWSENGKCLLIQPNVSI